MRSITATTALLFLTLGLVGCSGQSKPESAPEPQSTPVVASGPSQEEIANWADEALEKAELAWKESDGTALGMLSSNNGFWGAEGDDFEIPLNATCDALATMDARQFVIASIEIEDSYQDGVNAAYLAVAAENDYCAAREEALRVQAEEQAAAEAAAAAEKAAEAAMTVSQQQAVRKGNEYLDYTSFSRSGLIEQLEYEGFSNADATFAVDQISPDWNAQAAAKAQEYLDYTSFSRSGLIDQLLYEGFTREQAEHGANSVGLE